MIDIILSLAQGKMRKAIEITRTDLSSIRSGRATGALVENIVITAYEGTQKLKLQEMATIGVPDAKTIVITPYDPSVAQDIVKSIQTEGTGLTPVFDGEVIRITIPPMNQEQREDYIKLARTKLEGGRIMVRQIRQEAMKDLKREAENAVITEDQQKVGEKKVQELTDEMISEVDSLGERKEVELMQV
ncbi:MAG: ribosome recycling factor [Candidatus Gottesmanbacteria bacterium]